MKSWEMSVEDIKCVLCGKEEETIDHLFFECDLTTIVWKKVLEFCYIYKGLYP